jgi:hypothetical protein
MQCIESLRDIKSGGSVNGLGLELAKALLPNELGRKDFPNLAYLK